jgi:hypothetical protein
VNLTKNEIIDHCNKTQDIFLLNLISNNHKECSEFFNNLFEQISNNIAVLKQDSNANVDINLIEKMMKILFYLKGFRINTFDK